MKSNVTPATKPRTHVLKGPRAALVVPGHRRAFLSSGAALAMVAGVVTLVPGAASASGNT